MVKNERTTYGIIGIAAAAALSFLVAGSASANFHGTDITTTWELWNGASPGDGGSLLAVTDTATVTASDSVIPDISDFHDSTGTTNELWDVEFPFRISATSMTVPERPMSSGMSSFSAIRSA